MTLFLKNPHSILAALRTRPRDVLSIASGMHQSVSEVWNEIYEIALELKIPISREHRKKIFLENDLGRSSSSIEAQVRERADVSMESLFEENLNFERKSSHKIWLGLDCLQDSRNIGAIFRSAAFFKISGIIITADRSAPLNSITYDVASGGMEYVPFSIQTNLQRVFDTAKNAGIWVLGTSESAKDDYRSIPLDRSWLIVLGNEEKGLRRLTIDCCDWLCKIPSDSTVSSLNVSVASGILMSRFSS